MQGVDNIMYVVCLALSVTETAYGILPQRLTAERMDMGSTAPSIAKLGLRIEFRAQPELPCSLQGESSIGRN